MFFDVGKNHAHTLKMAEVVLSEKAYCKMMLHAVKYPHCSVNGILLAEKGKLKDSKPLPIVDCVPMFHCIGLTPMIEVALTQIDYHCKEKKMVLAGYYQANVNYKDSSPDYFAFRIAEKLQKQFNETVLIMIDNKKLSMDCEEIALYLYQYLGDDKWKQREGNSITLEKKETTLAALSSLLHSKSYRTLVDFDNHLDNIALSWENISLNEEISRLL